MTLPGTPLEAPEYSDLEARWISREFADAARLRHVDSVTGAGIVGQQAGRGDYSGILIPNIRPGEPSPRGYRIRRRHPEMEGGADGVLRPRRKYIGEPGRSGTLYFPVGTDASLLADTTLPIVLVEGEFKTIALDRLSRHGGEGLRSFLPLGLQGVWNWRGTIGKTADADGARVDVHGVIPDLSLVDWSGRRVVIAFDVNARSNLGVQAARKNLTDELEVRGTKMAWLVWPKDTPAEVNGIDDYLAARGPEAALELLIKARDVSVKKKARSASVVNEIPPGDWRQELIRDAEQRPLSILANAITALRRAPEFDGRIGFDEFATRVVAVEAMPWRADPHDWGDAEDIHLAEWLQHQGIYVSRELAGQAVEVVSRGKTFHPPRDYFSGLEWDGEARLDCGAETYFGARASPYGGIKYLRAIFSCWMKSAAARVYQPGCKVDCVFIPEGPQGLGKSTAIRILAPREEWFCDEIGDFGSKDASLQLHGKLLIELPELDALGRAENTRAKAFLSRSTDHFRPPYGKRVIDLGRQCVFAGTSNRTDFLKDETGGRRFWPFACGVIDLAAIERDRDQLWAEAVARYRAGEAWWLDTSELVGRAQAEQAARYQSDAWEDPVIDWADGRIAAGCDSVSVAEALEVALQKPRGQWSTGDAMRVGRVLTAAKWERYKDRNSGWRYRPPRLE